MAEIELSILARQCLDRRIAEFVMLQSEVAAWVEQRNQEQAWIDWRFTTNDARVKLKRLYPLVNYSRTTSVVYSCDSFNASKTHTIDVHF